MNISNTRYYKDQDFADYLAMPGHSFSGIKGAVMAPTTGMTLGTAVHNYLLEPAKFDWKDAAAIAIANAVRAYLGASLKHMQKEVAFTSEFIHNGMAMPYKGRADMLSLGRLVVDLKILAGALAPACNYFSYDRQTSGYCLATGCERGLIVAYNRASKKVETKMIIPTSDWWEYQVVRLGEPVKSAV